MTIIFESGYDTENGENGQYPMFNTYFLHSRNWREGGTITASSTDSDYFEDGPDNSLTYERWKPSAAGAQTWEHDFGATYYTSGCAIGAHTLGTSGCTIKAQYHNGSTWVDLCDATPITTDEPIMIFWTAVTQQRFRINITAATSAPEIGVIKFGFMNSFPRPIFGGIAPPVLGRKPKIRGNYSYTGEYLGRTRVRSILSTSLEWRHLPEDWVHSTFYNFQRAMEAEPFFIAWRPGTYSDVSFAQVDEIPHPQNMGISDLMSVSMSFRARAWN